MPIEKQRTLAIVIQRMQNGGKIEMGPFSELNYETASNVNQNIANIFEQRFYTLLSHF